MPNDAATEVAVVVVPAVDPGCGWIWVKNLTARPGGHRTRTDGREKERASKHPPSESESENGPPRIVCVHKQNSLSSTKFLSPTRGGPPHLSSSPLSIHSLSCTTSSSSPPSLESVQPVLCSFAHHLVRLRHWLLLPNTTTAPPTTATPTVEFQKRARQRNG